MIVPRPNVSLAARFALTLASLALASCGTAPGVDDTGAESMPGAEMDHSAHMGGGAAGGERQAVQLSAQQERALGVVYMTVERRPLERTIRTVGRIVTAESRVVDFSPRIGGFVERLLVNTTGQEVHRGQPLLTIYSPELVAAQEELLTARNLARRLDESAGGAWDRANDMLEATRRRLSWWEITDEQIRRLEETGEVTRTLTLVSPVSGVVLEKSVFEGRRVIPGESLYVLADLTEVWVEGDVFEQDLQFVSLGAQSHIEVSAYPGEHVMGDVSFIYPTIDVSSRTNRVRVTLPNPDLRFKPGMFATMFFESSIAEAAVAIPVDAVLVTGERNLVFVREDGLLQPREVVVGAHAQDYLQILSGIAPGETIVASANFLIDAESRLGSTSGGMPGMGAEGQGSAVEPVNDSEAEDEHAGHDMPAVAPAPAPEHQHD